MDVKGPTSKNFYYHKNTQSSEIRGLCSMKCSREMLQNLIYLMYEKVHVGSFFRFSFHTTFNFYIMNALVYVDIDRAFIRENVKLHDMIMKKTTWVFLYIKYSKF